MKRHTLSKIFAASVLGISALAHAATPVIDVYKSASCGCCHKWVEHLQANGFKVNAKDVNNPTDYREKFGMPNDLGSCHTARVGRYTIEGHVPAADIKRLIAEKPKAIGLSVPSMPLGSPGMEGPRKDSYDVLLVQGNGKYSVYRHYGAN